MKYTLRKFVSFNAIEINCTKCSFSGELNNKNCLKCVNSIKVDFDLLELKKKFSKIYFEKELNYILKNKKKIKDLTPKVVPNFIKFYTTLISGEVIETCKEYSIIKNNHINYIIFNPIEYNLNFNELNTLNEFVLKIQNDDYKFKKNSSGIVPEHNEFLNKLIISYTKGLGFLNTILELPNISDIYINSPGNSCLFVVHPKYGQLSSNIYFKKEMINKISTFLRTDSGRPFDEAFPVLHTGIPKLNIRVCAISNPLSFGGIGFAIRKHKKKPFNLFNLVNLDSLSSEVAGLLWFLINNNLSILITGPRGSGKSSLLSSLMFFIGQENRFIVIEDTKELPIPTLKNQGFNIEHLKTISFGNDQNFELSSDVALKTALRLGDSVLIIGEVRGEEAKTLFEAMRIGISGGCVLGTIHGNSVIDTYDRIVNDLGITPSSFKAIDIIITCGYIQKKELKKRKILNINYVKKNWFNNPIKEKAFFKLIEFDSITNKYILNSLKNCELIKKIAYTKGVKPIKCIKEIKLRQKIFKHILTIKKKMRYKDKEFFTSKKVIEFNNYLNYLLNNFKDEKVIFNKFSNSIIKKKKKVKKSKEKIILSTLNLLKSFNKKTSINNKKLFKLLKEDFSRINFNKKINELEKKLKIKSYSKNNTKYVYINKKE